MNFSTGILAYYATPYPLLWGWQQGSGWLMNLTGSDGSWFFGIDENGCLVFPDGSYQCSGSDLNVSELNVTQLNATEICLGGDCRTEWPSTTDENITGTWTFLNDTYFNQSVYITDNLTVNEWINAYGTNVSEINATEICLGGDCQTEWPTGIGIFINTTPDSYTGSISYNGLTGYQAANAICDNNFTGTHMCTQAEIISTIHEMNISEIDEWVDGRQAWVNAGGPKYAPADFPADDCGGWTTGTDGKIGNFWTFNKTTGGMGEAATCEQSLRLACCR